MQYINSCCKKNNGQTYRVVKKNSFIRSNCWLKNQHDDTDLTDIMLAVACMATWRTKSVSSVQSVDKKRFSRALIISVVPCAKKKKLPHFLKFFLFVTIL